jgi:manganese transport protein
VPAIIVPPNYHRIAVALDFSSDDGKILSHAIGQGSKDSTFVLIHVVESVPAKYLGHLSDDLETRQDMERLQEYVGQLKQMGWKAEGRLGYHERINEISRLVKVHEADLLVIGAHGHSGVKDVIFGETINSLRHELKIPLLVVNL